jgi:hypothetical protein
MLGKSSNNFYGLGIELLLLLFDNGRDFWGDSDFLCSFSYFFYSFMTKTSVKLSDLKIIFKKFYKKLI